MPLDSFPAINNQSFTGQFSEVTPITSEMSLWLQDSQNELQRLKNLPKNWDSYGSSEITDKASKKTADLLHKSACLGLNKPNLFPVSGGGLQLEWQNAGRELEIEILPEGDIEFLIVDENGKMKEGRAVEADILRLARWYRMGENNVMSL